MKIKVDYETIAILALLLISGTTISLVDYKIAFFLFCFSTFMLLIHKQKIVRENVYILGLLVLLNGLSSCINVNFDAKVLLSKIIIYIMLVIFASNVSFEKFRKVFINFECIVAAISLVCFFIVTVNPSFHLPFEFAVNGSTDFYGALYYTRGISASFVFSRNAGIYAEPGVYQIFLNVCLMLLFFSPKFDIKKELKKVIVLVIALLTTLSTTGYMCFAILLFAFLISKRKGNNKKINSSIKGLAIILVGVLLFVENKLGIIEEKLLNQGGSYGTRMDDVLTGISLVSQKPLLGYGAFGNVSTVWEMYTDNLSRSNGLVNECVSGGIIFVLVYIMFFYRKTKLIYPNNIILQLLIMFMIVICFVSEPIMSLPFFMYFLFKWKRDSGGVIND